MVTSAHRLSPPALVACSALGLALLTGRVLRSGSPSFVFLAWNLLLAWIPYGAAALAGRLSARPAPAPRLRLLLALSLWLLFFPNAPYLVTDLLHLKARPPVPLWYDLAMLSTFAWCGMLLGIASLGGAHQVVGERLGRRAGWLFVAGAAALGGLGIYLGRFERWNSWDLLLQPATLLGDVAGRLRHPLRNVRTFSVSAVFGALILTSYAAVALRGEEAGGR